MIISRIGDDKMILKKPYAFLIKYFKLINFISVLAIAFLIYKNYQIIGFYNDYILNNYFGTFYENFYINYISLYSFTCIFIILLNSVIISTLFIYKKKPIKLYLFTGAFYFIYFIILIIFKNNMIGLVDNLMNGQTARIYRDISIIALFPNILILIPLFIRSLGFNIKKFEFDKDLEELEINENDNEEIEINLIKDTSKIKRNIRKYFREFGYYFKENKFMVLIALLIISVVMGFIIYKAIPKNHNNYYNQGSTFYSHNLSMSVKDSIITNLSKNGEKISDSYYLVISLDIENKSNDTVNLDYNMFKLEIDNINKYPVINKNSYFIDYGINNYNGLIKKNSKNTYLLVYELEESIVKEEYKIKIDNGFYNEKGIKSKYIYINLTPIKLTEIVKEKEVGLNEQISFLNSNLGNTILKISNPLITDKYMYKYNYCFNDKCNDYDDIVTIDYKKNNQTLIVFDYEITFDETKPFYSSSNTFSTFITNYLKILYLDNDEYIYSSINNVTPKSLSNKAIIETTRDIKNSNEIYLSFIIRNKEYLVKIK